MRREILQETQERLRGGKGDATMGEKTLNDQIEGIFQGIVFVLFSFVASIFIIILNPRTGFIALIRRMRRKGENQIRPYVFAFLAISLVLFLPAIIRDLAPASPSLFEYQVHDSEFQTPGRVGRVYEEARRQIETKGATSIFVAAIIGVAALQIGAILVGFAV